MKQDEIKEYFTNPLLYQQYNAGFYSPEELKDFGFKSLGENVLISRLAQIYAPHKIAIGSNVRIDDFAILSGAITLGSFIHISSHSNITGGDGISASVSMGDFCSLSLGSRILSLSDDLSGEVLINSCIPSQYRHIIASHIHLPKHNHIAAMSLVLPQTTFEEGANLGPNSLAGGITLKSYGYYFGSPARLLKLLDSEAIKMREAQFLAQYEQDCKKQRGGGISRTFLSHTHYKIYITLPQYKATSTFCSATKESQLLSHFKHCKESLSDLLATPLACHVFSLGSKAEELLLSAKDFSKESLENLLSCHHEPFLEGEESLLDLLENPLVCHSERSEESLQESLVAKRDSSPLAGVQNDKLCYPQGKPTHNKHLQRKLLCHSERYGESLRKATRQSLSYCHSEGFMPEESLLDLLTTLLVCHSERGQSPTEESLKESLVAKRDSSPLAGVRDANKSQTSPSSEIYSHCDKIKSHEVPPLKASSGVRSISSNDIQSMAGGIYKGARVLLWGWTSRTSEALAPHYFIKLCTFKPLPLIEKEKRESTSDSHRDSSVVSTPARHDNESNPQDKITLQGKLFCHSKHCEESQPESPATPLVCHSEGARSATEESLLSAKDFLTESRERQLLCHSERSEESLQESLVAKRDSSPLAGVQNDNSGRVSSNSKGDSSGFQVLRYGKLISFMRKPHYDVFGQKMTICLPTQEIKVIKAKRSIA